MALEHRCTNCGYTVREISGKCKLCGGARWSAIEIRTCEAHDEPKEIDHDKFSSRGEAYAKWDDRSWPSVIPRTHGHSIVHETGVVKSRRRYGGISVGGGILPRVP